MRKVCRLALGTLAMGTALHVSGQTTVFSYTVPAGGYDSRSNLTSYSDTVNGSWTLSYDGLSRLAGASASNGPYQGLGLQWGYDSFGNRQSQTETGSPPTAGSYSEWAHFTDATNRAIASNQAVGGLGYDAAGNITFDGMNHSLYDAENRLCASQSGATGTVTQYIYDAEGNRVAKTSAGTLVCYTGPGTPSVTAKYVVDPSGNPMTELDGMGNWRHTNVYGNGQLLATYDTRGLHFPLTDHLGTVRVWASGLGAQEETCSSLPFGDVQSCTGTDPTEQHFTGKERDTESGLDYFGARYYGSSMGRFMSPDPSGLAFANPANPQSLNLYSYALNNPLINIDPTGMECVWDDGSYDSADDPQTGNAQGCSGQGGTYVNPDLFENALLTNGQNANIQYGSWSGSANSTLASSWTTASGTAYGGPWAAGQEVDEAVNLFYGNGAKLTLIYNNNDPFTMSFKGSLGMQGILAGVKSNCSATSGSVPVGTWEAFANTMIDGPYLKSADGSVMSGYYTPEAQMGGFNSTYSRSGGVVNITVTNPISLNSFALHATAPLGIPNPSSGHFGTVNQQLNITAPDPCGGS